MAAPGGGGRGGLGWLILAAALAVPGFLFYNWWSHLKSEHERGVSAQARARAEGGVFQAAPPAERLVNPMAPAAAAATPAGAAAARKPAAAPGVPAAPAAAALAPMGAPTAAYAAPDAPGAVATSSAATVVLPRDPMMSPLDTVRIREEEAEREARAEALRNERLPRRRKTQKKPPIESRIELQGIVAKSDGDNLAIINGSTVNPGEHFTVEGYEGKVRVVRITSAQVTLEYQGRRIRLSVNAE